MRVLPNVSPIGAVLLIATLTGCASGKPTTAPAPATTSVSGALGAAGDSGATVAPAVIRGTSRPADAVKKSDRQVLTRDEIRSTQFTNAYDVIQSLRGNWLRARSAESFGTSSTVQVYLDQQRLSGVAELRTCRR